MGRPSGLLLGIEGIRSLYEYGIGWLLQMPLQFISPKGDGHPVIIIPGLGTADGSTHYARNFIKSIGYESHPWGLGRNLGPRRGMENLLHQLLERVQDVYDKSGGQEISLIGWSLGGIYAREIAKVRPDLIRQVITLGTPFKSVTDGTNVARLYEIGRASCRERV